MPPATRSLRPLINVGLPVAVTAVLVTLAIVNVILVKRWQGELEDAVLWKDVGVNVVAVEVAAGGAGERAGLEPRDVLLMIDGREITSRSQVFDVMHESAPGRVLTYTIQRAAGDLPIAVELLPMPRAQSRLYYSLALVGILSILVGTSVRLRRPNDVSTLHFFWLTVAFFGALAFTPSGRYDGLDYFFDWADMVARLALPPLFLHFALGFPERPSPWAKSDSGRKLLPLIYLPAVVLGVARVVAFRNRVEDAAVSRLLDQIEWVSLLYLGVCLVAGLADHAAGADTAALGDGRPATALDRVGFGHRRVPVHRALRRALSAGTRAAVCRIYSSASRVACRSPLPRHSCATG